MESTIRDSNKYSHSSSYSSSSNNNNNKRKSSRNSSSSNSSNNKNKNIDCYSYQADRSTSVSIVLNLLPLVGRDGIGELCQLQRCGGDRSGGRDGRIVEEVEAQAVEVVQGVAAQVVILF